VCDKPGHVHWTNHALTVVWSAEITTCTRHDAVLRNKPAKFSDKSTLGYTEHNEQHEKLPKLFKIFWKQCSYRFNMVLLYFIIVYWYIQAMANDMYLFTGRFHWVQWQQWKKLLSGLVTRTSMWECVVTLLCMESAMLHFRWFVDLCYYFIDLPMLCDVP